MRAVSVLTCVTARWRRRLVRARGRRRCLESVGAVEGQQPQGADRAARAPSGLPRYAHRPIHCRRATDRRSPTDATQRRPWPTSAALRATASRTRTRTRRGATTSTWRASARRWRRTRRPRCSSRGERGAPLLACFPFLGRPVLTPVWIAGRVHRRYLKEMLGASTGKTRVQKVLVLLVESGAIYLAVWVSPAPPRPAPPHG